MWARFIYNSMTAALCCVSIEQWPLFTVTRPFSAEGSSHWMTIVVELKGRTRTFLGADPGSEKNQGLALSQVQKQICGIFLNEINKTIILSKLATTCLIEVSLIQAAPRQV